MARRNGGLFSKCGGWLTRAVTSALLACVPLGLAQAVDKQASFVIDGNTGAVLHDQSADEPRYPASLTKMMTLYMVFEQIEAGRMNDDTMLTISVACASMAPSKIGLEVGERISLGNAIKAVVTKSANDMACAIAEAVSGSESVFALRMTERARAIGMTRTTFRNASGLPDPRQITTARDMATLGLRLRDDFPKQYPIFQLRSFSYGGKTYKSHNTLMNGFVGMDGIKTGYTRASGFNLVSSVQRDGKYVVGAVFGGVTASVRNAHMRMILFRALADASTQRTRKAGPALVARAAPAKKPVKPTLVAEAKGAVADVKAVKAATKVEAKAAPKPAKAPPVTTAQASSANGIGADQPPAAEPAIKIAKVRAVMVAGQVAGAAPPSAVGAPPAAVETAAPAAPPAKQPPRFATASVAPPSLNFASAANAAAPARAERPPVQDMEGLIAGSPPRATGTPRAPGTLGAQAAAFAARPPPQAGDSGLRPSVDDRPRAGVSSDGGYLIQVGAFASEDECKRHLETVRGRAVDILRGRPARAEGATVNNKQIYRARFAAFDGAGANAACSSLRQQKVDCMVLKAP